MPNGGSAVPFSMVFFLYAATIAVTVGDAVRARDGVQMGAQYQLFGVTTGLTVAVKFFASELLNTTIPLGMLYTQLVLPNPASVIWILLLCGFQGCP